MKFIISIVALIVLAGTGWAETSAGTCEVTALKTFGAGRLLPMVVFGDSVTWGDGLRDAPGAMPGHKFTALVADWLAQNTGREVERTVYAHSAASILPSPTVPDKGLRFPGDVNSFYSTISDQVECVAEQKRADVELILINGCINDVGAFEPVNPQNSKRQVAKLTKKFCGAPVESLLRKTATLYPHAIIIATGYYPIISEQSDIAPFLDFLHAFFPERSKQLLAKDGGREKSKSAENSKAFYDHSNQLFTDGVDHVNHDLGETRLFFVKLPFSPENAFGAPNSYLWPIPTIVSQDEVYLVRQAQCLDAFGIDLTGLAICDLDPTAHPNVKGSQVIAGEIEKVLTDLLPRWHSEVNQPASH